MHLYKREIGGFTTVEEENMVMEPVMAETRLQITIYRQPAEARRLKHRFSPTDSPLWTEATLSPRDVHCKLQVSKLLENEFLLFQITEFVVSCNLANEYRRLHSDLFL